MDDTDDFVHNIRSLVKAGGDGAGRPDALDDTGGAGAGAGGGRQMMMDEDGVTGSGRGDGLGTGDGIPAAGEESTLSRNNSRGNLRESMSKFPAFLDGEWLALNWSFPVIPPSLRRNPNAARVLCDLEALHEHPLRPSTPMDMFTLSSDPDDVQNMVASGAGGMAAANALKRAASGGMLGMDGADDGSGTGGMDEAEGDDGDPNTIGVGATPNEIKAAHFSLALTRLMAHQNAKERTVGVGPQHRPSLYDGYVHDGERVLVGSPHRWNNTPPAHLRAAAARANTRDADASTDAGSDDEDGAPGHRRRRSQRMAYIERPSSRRSVVEIDMPEERDLEYRISQKMVKLTKSALGEMGSLRAIANETTRARLESKNLVSATPVTAGVSGRLGRLSSPPPQTPGGDDRMAVTWADGPPSSSSEAADNGGGCSDGDSSGRRRRRRRRQDAADGDGDGDGGTEEGGSTRRSSKGSRSSRGSARRSPDKTSTRGADMFFQDNTPMVLTTAHMTQSDREELAATAATLIGALHTKNGIDPTAMDEAFELFRSAVLRDTHASQAEAEVLEEELAKEAEEIRQREEATEAAVEAGVISGMNVDDDALSDRPQTVHTPRRAAPSSGHTPAIHPAAATLTSLNVHLGSAAVPGAFLDREDDLDGQDLAGSDMGSEIGSEEASEYGGILDDSVSETGSASSRCRRRGSKSSLASSSRKSSKRRSSKSSARRRGRDASVASSLISAPGAPESKSCDNNNDDDAHSVEHKASAGADIDNDAERSASPEGGSDADNVGGSDEEDERPPRRSDRRGERGSMSSVRSSQSRHSTSSRSDRRRRRSKDTDEGSQSRSPPLDRKTRRPSRSVHREDSCRSTASGTPRASDRRTDSARTSTPRASDSRRRSNSPRGPEARRSSAAHEGSGSTPRASEGRDSSAASRTPRASEGRRSSAARGTPRASEGRRSSRRSISREGSGSRASSAATGELHALKGVDLSVERPLSDSVPRESDNLTPSHRRDSSRHSVHSAATEVNQAL